MANALFKALPDYPARLGPKQMIVGDYTGPTSTLVTGDVIGVTNNLTGVTIAGLSAIDQIEGSGNYSVSGAYWVQVKPSGLGPRKTWNLFWNASGGVVSVAQNVAGSGMTPGTYISTAATGGVGGVGAQIQVTVLTATTIGPIVVLNSGRGYTTLPTGFTVATGGTPPTFTITGNTAGPVAAGVDLSAQTVRLSIIGR